MKPLKLDRTVFIPSISQYDLSVRRFDDEKAAKKRFVSHRKWEQIVQSDIRQKENLDIAQAGLGTVLFLDRSELSDHIIRNNDHFVLMGGDDHLTWVSQIILQYLRAHPEEEKYVIGVVLDPLRSSGNILNFSVDTLLANIKNLKQGDYAVEYWTTLEAVVESGDGLLRPYPAAAHFFAGELFNPLMSRHDAFYQKAFLEGEEILQEKGSGILVAVGPGAGPGSWYDTVHQIYFSQSDDLPFDADRAGILVRENKEKPKATLEKGQTLVLVSYNDTQGILSPDSHLDHSVRYEMGSIAKIWISDLKLPVVKVDRD